jgi:pilus assembly protein CpaF
MIEHLSQQFVGQARMILPYLEDEEVTDILINGVRTFFVERKGELEQHPNPFEQHQSLFHFIERILVPIGKRIDATAPYVDGRLLDGSRFNIVMAPLAIEGPLISIRKKKRSELLPIELFGPPEITDWIIQSLMQKKTFLISGGTGTGKTTLLSSLVSRLPPQERIVLIEEVSELEPNHPHLIHLEARPPNPEGRGEVSLRTLVHTALRIRPDRLIVGECRGGEAFDMLQAMNTGHGGSLGTLHANSALDALRRFESLALLAGLQIPLKVVREWIGAHVFGVVHLQRINGKRCISEVLTVSGLEGEVYRSQPRFKLR